MICVVVRVCLCDLKVSEMFALFMFWYLLLHCRLPITPYVCMLMYYVLYIYILYIYIYMSMYICMSMYIYIYIYIHIFYMLYALIKVQLCVSRHVSLLSKFSAVLLTEWNLQGARWSQRPLLPWYWPPCQCQKQLNHELQLRLYRCTPPEALRPSSCNTEDERWLAPGWDSFSPETSEGWCQAKLGSRSWEARKPHRDASVWLEQKTATRI